VIESRSFVKSKPLPKILRQPSLNNWSSY